MKGQSSFHKEPDHYKKSRARRRNNSNSIWSNQSPNGSFSSVPDGRYTVELKEVEIDKNIHELNIGCAQFSNKNIPDKLIDNVVVFIQDTLFNKWGNTNPEEQFIFIEENDEHKRIYFCTDDFALVNEQLHKNKSFKEICFFIMLFLRDKLINGNPYKFSRKELKQLNKTKIMFGPNINIMKDYLVNNNPRHVYKLM